MTPLTEDCKHWADKGHTVVILSTDVSIKAFNSLHPNLLLATLKAYGLSDPALKLMQSSNLTTAWGYLNRAAHRDHL